MKKFELLEIVIGGCAEAEECHCEESAECHQQPKKLAAEEIVESVEVL